MAFTTKIRRLAARQIASWRIDDLLVDVYRHLCETLPANPSANLIRDRKLFDGMVCGFRIVDPANRFTEHKFLFHVMYGADELSGKRSTLFVLRVCHRCDTGVP
jgi:hypothetical protein